jgi:hypothetical protein
MQVDKKELEAVAVKKDFTEKLEELQAQVHKYEKELEQANRLAAEQREADVVRKTQVCGVLNNCTCCSSILCSIAEVLGQWALQMLIHYHPHSVPMLYQRTIGNSQINFELFSTRNAYDGVGRFSAG